MHSLHRLLSSVLSGLCLTAVASFAAEETLTINGQSFTRPQLEKAYQGVAKSYGTAGEGKVGSIKQLDAKALYGKVIETSGTLTIVDLGAGYAALIGRQRYRVSDTDLTFVGKAIGTYTWETFDRTKRTIPQYKNLTLSRADFIRHLKSGYPFAEPSLIARQTKGSSKMFIPNQANPGQPTPPAAVKPQAAGLRKGKPGSLAARPGSQFERKKVGK